MAPPSNWIWSGEHKDYYRTYKDQNGVWKYSWFKQESSGSRDTRHDSPIETAIGAASAALTYETNAVPCQGQVNPGYSVPVTQSIATAGQVNQSSANTRSGGTARRIQGMPNGNTEDKLDSSYKMRHKSFFRIGRVFSILYTEACGDTMPEENQTDFTNITYVKFNERVYSQIRRFVVVNEKHGYCKACPIFTYKKRGTTKPGVDPSAHAIIYTSGQTPTLLEGETGISKDPICVVPSKPNLILTPASRINYSIDYPIQHNVKVKDWGNVHKDQIDLLCACWKAERD